MSYVVLTPATYAVPNFPRLSDNSVAPIGSTVSYPVRSPRRTTRAPFGTFERSRPRDQMAAMGPSN